MNPRASNSLSHAGAVTINSPELSGNTVDAGMQTPENGLPRRRIPDPKGTSGGIESWRSGEPPRCAELGAIRGNLFRQLQEGAIHSFRDQLPQYASTLERLLRGAANNPAEQLRLEADHRMFFEQVKAVLVTNRIQLRLELERVKVSRRYGREGVKSSGAGWEG